MKQIFAALLLAAVFYSCDHADKKTRPAHDILADDLDTTVRPGDDFFQYANGGWIKRTPIPAAESGWGIYNMVQDELYARLKKINEDAVKDKAAKGTISQKIADFWESGMDSAAIEKAGLSPLDTDMKKIDAVTNARALVSLIAAFHNKGIGCFFDMGVHQDDKRSDVMAFYLYQGGLGLPNRDYFFNTDERTVKVKTAYKDYMLKTFRQIDSVNAEKNVEDVFALETKLAKASRKLAALRDPYKNYNKMSWAAMGKLAPAIDWMLYAKLTGANKVDSVIAGQPEFFTALSRQVTETPLATWKSYLKLSLVQGSAAYLDSKTYGNYFDFRKTLTGSTEPRVRWKRVLDAEEGTMGEALGQLFVKEYFTATAKKRYNEIVENIRAAYKDRIAALPWMSDSTKQKAYLKLARITQKVGYPDKWKDFSNLAIEKGPWINNIFRGAEWWSRYEMNKLGKPVDRTEWEMTPQTYNAYYNPANNEIVLPAGIFAVPGYKDEDLDDALVYGYAGASTVGHEITHGFDDQGRQYDADGNLKDWWTKKDADEFSTRAGFIIRQFNEFNPVDTLHINGDATQGENIADLGGLLLGLDAFKKTAAYKKNEKISGLTPLQRYFLGYALGWLYTTKKERLANLVMTDVHSPAKERVNGPMVNIPEFYEAFGIKKGDKMYRPDSLRVHIW